ncbi:hypothetical protein C479_09188 [Halovivax asiaticus JCM 14624]|uniref:DUF7343 domain-containing protein n=1 Tax=Halovivax asiaticus JCM 14624 TaxID=1227490 RepID=M0BKY9_9EURY|nr:helix-turn-helix domain-containing protein [Halovivax asiaticus]ELZ10973.1 hypothetical protein C479_09188 [Halovivax asiaticus JCM 14624]
MIGRSRAISAPLRSVLGGLVVPIATATPVGATHGNAAVLDGVTAATAQNLALGVGAGISSRELVFVLGGAVLALAVVTAGLAYRYEPRIGADRRPSEDGSEPLDRPESNRETERSYDPAPDREQPSRPLTDFERVVRLLEENEGKLPQSEIVARTPWSKSKVSRLLTRMNDNDQVRKVNAGRQNIIVLPGSEPDEPHVLPDGDGI